MRETYSMTELIVRAWIQHLVALTAVPIGLTQKAGDYNRQVKGILYI